jgi:hypothetical protein
VVTKVNTMPSEVWCLSRAGRPASQARACVDYQHAGRRKIPLSVAQTVINKFPRTAEPPPHSDSHEKNMVVLAPFSLMGDCICCGNGFASPCRPDPYTRCRALEHQPILIQPRRFVVGLLTVRYFHNTCKAVAR